MSERVTLGHLRLALPIRESNVAVDGFDLVPGMLLVLGGDSEQRRDRTKTAPVELVRVRFLHGRGADVRAAVTRGYGGSPVRDWPSGTTVRPVDLE